MDLKLSNFKTVIDKPILERGRRYLRGGHVVDLKEVSKGRWLARVEGNEIYEIAIQQDAMGLLTCECTCPYDWGPFCKHIAAVLYAMEESLPGNTDSTLRRPQKKRKTQEEKVHDALLGLAYEELVNLLEELAAYDRQIANMIVARFGDVGNDKKAYIRLVKDALKMGKGKRGYIDYYGSGRAAEGVRNILFRADMLIKQGSVKNAIPIYQAVIETVVPAIAHADDSNGELGDCIYFGFRGLAGAIQNLPLIEKQKAFGYCLEVAQKEPFSGWHWRWDLAQIAADNITTKDQRQQLFAVLDKMAGENGEGECIGITGYKYTQAESIKLSVIERLDDDETKRAFLEQHLEIEKFREHLVQFHIQRDNLDEARRLCKEWLEKKGQRHKGFRSVFLDFLLEIARQEKQEDEIVLLAKALLFDSGDFKYFDLLKEVTTESEWPDTRDQLITAAKASGRHPDIVHKIFFREEMWRQLLGCMDEKHRTTLSHYGKYLEPRFPEEISAIYGRIVWALMEEKPNRKGYKEACCYIRRMKKLKQVNQTNALVDALQEKYYRRPVLLDELRKV